MKHCCNRCNCETSCNEESVVGLIICSVCAKEMEELRSEKLRLWVENLELKEEIADLKEANRYLSDYIQYMN